MINNLIQASCKNILQNYMIIEVSNMYTIFISIMNISDINKNKLYNIGFYYKHLNTLYNNIDFQYKYLHTL